MDIINNIFFIPPLTLTLTLILTLILSLVLFLSVVLFLSLILTLTLTGRTVGSFHAFMPSCLHAFMSDACTPLPFFPFSLFLFFLRFLRTYLCNLSIVSCPSLASCACTLPISCSCDSVREACPPAVDIYLQKKKILVWWLHAMLVI